MIQLFSNKIIRLSTLGIVISCILANLCCSTREHSNPLDPDFAGSSDEAATELISRGWSLFEAGEYREASGIFSQAVNKFGTIAEAYTGWGWSLSMIGNIDSAQVVFEQALIIDSRQIDSFAGLAVVLRDVPDYQTAIENAEEVLSMNPGYAFAHDSSIDFKDMRLIIAESCVRLGTEFFAKAQDQIDELFPANGLKSADPSTWRVENVLYDSYAVALIAIIEMLHATIAQ